MNFKVGRAAPRAPFAWRLLRAIRSFPVAAVPPHRGRTYAVGINARPHPGPLPRGEGDGFDRARPSQRLVTAPAGPNGSPSPFPKGRGPG